MSAVDRARLCGNAQTVLGVIDPETLGSTLMHEHVLCDITPPSLAATTCDCGPPITLQNVWKINYGTEETKRKYELNRKDVAIVEIVEMMSAGGSTIVELTCGGLKPDPQGLVEIAKDTGANIVMGCGHYVENYQAPANRERSVDSFAAEIVSQITEGAWGTDVRAGIIGEIGCQAPWTALEKKVMRGAILAQQETGAAVNVHPGRHQDQPQEVAEFIARFGGRIDRVVISHIDRTIFDEGRLLRLADTGCVIEFDLFGIEHSYYSLADIDMPNDAVRLRLIRTLIDHGHLDQVVISHDICTITRLRTFGGHGYSHIFTNVVPMMHRRNFDEREIKAILVDNPKRLLTFI